MGRFFGTDGIRGRAGEAPLDAATVQKIGRAIVRALGISEPRVLIGRDTRESGPGIEQHLAAGLAAEGAHPESAGVIPTPAIAHLARQRSGLRRRGYHLGVVISASHNPYQDNGIKVFGGAGRKFSTDLEDKTEAIIEELSGQAMREARGVEPRDLARPYVDHLKRSYGGPSLKGMHLVVDCANGATSFLARRVFTELGARVTAINDQPDGRNINRECGATHPECVAARVKSTIGTITSTTTESSGSKPSRIARARALNPSMVSATDRASTSRLRPSSVSFG